MWTLYLNNHLPSLEKLNPWYERPLPSQNFRPEHYTGNLIVTATACVDAEPVPGNNQMDKWTKLVIANTAISHGWAPRDQQTWYTQSGGPKHVLFFINHTETKKGDGEKGYIFEHIRAALFAKFDDLQDSVPEAQCVSVQDSLGSTRSFVWGTDEDLVESTECQWGMHSKHCVSVDSSLNRLDEVVFHKLVNQQ